MPLFTLNRAIALAVAVVFIAMLVVGSSMGMFGSMFEGFFPTINLSGTPAAGTSAAGTPAAGTSTGARPAATPTVRR